LLDKLLFETIKIEDGLISNIYWHNQRCNRSRKALFKSQNDIDLEAFITAPTKGLYRCRIVYNDNIQSVEYIPYQAKQINSIKIIKSQIDYEYKYNNRDELTQLLEKEYDDILIEKNGFLTDTSIANIAFYTDSKWITPKQPLLRGTFREKLLKKGFLILKDIKKEEITYFSHFALMNAMIGFQIQENIHIEL